MWELPISIVLGVLSAKGIILFFLIRLVWRTQLRSGDTNPARMIGLPGKAVTDVAGEGRVLVQGEYWWARARTQVAQGQRVRIIGIEGMTLEVEPTPDKSLIPRPVSAVVLSDAKHQ